jgi:predicted AlkP superfamily pyrophosphatase or phosphodiesterase
VGALVVTACAGAQSGPAASATAAERPTMVVLITVDQMRGNYLDRFAPQLTGGLARLSRGGASFSNAHHDHAITETAPGHASLLSGRFPRSTGITANRVGVFDTAYTLIGSPTVPAASPRRFRGTTLVDWIVAADSRARALSVSMKDRGAILPVGTSKQEVYWYPGDGTFTTSTYYRDSLPSWVRAFNARHLPQRYAGKSWTPLLPDSAYPEPDDNPAEGSGAQIVFPHALPDDSAAAASGIRVTPWMDEVTVAMALDGVRALRLGTGPSTDVLAVSLSATDIIGHGYGPDSRELHDQILRLDRLLGAFIDSLYRLRDSSRIVFALSGDHGVGMIPELARSLGDTNATRVQSSSLFAAFRARLDARGASPDAFELDQQLIFANRAALARARVNADSLLRAFRDSALKIPGIARVDRYADLAADTTGDPIARRWRHQFGDAPDLALVITLTPNSLWGSSVASHGSPYDYDSNVPLLFYGPGFAAGRHTEFVRTVDLAPTLAARVGVRPLERLDGVVLNAALTTRR